MDKSFWAKVDVKGPLDCWEWKSPPTSAGYGQIKLDRRMRRAHRVAWELHNGPIAAGMWVLHRCDNRPCCNPAHLFLGTPADNTADMVAKKRNRPPPSKISQTDVASIFERANAGETQASIAKSFGVHFGVINKILLGKSHQRDIAECGAQVRIYNPEETLCRTKPWEAMAISQRTWYRRRA
jgi:hypothetical protein